MKCDDINIRDPFVLVYEGKYYLYGTRGETAFMGQAYGFDVYISEDMENFKGPIEVFRRPEGFFSKKNYWAPEVYYYHDKFYMFATFANGRKGLGTAVLIAERPVGPFRLWSDGYITPKNSRCLDGTLYIARNKIPYMVYCHEWQEIQDGPFLIRTDDDKLHMLWSTYTAKGYVEAMAHSSNNEIDGLWNPDETLLYDHDGGHGMIFKDKNNQYNLVLHYPNTIRREHPKFIPIEYKDGKWKM